MSQALIGYTGFVGGNLLAQNKFDHLYNSSNIQEIEGKHFELIVCAAPSAAVYMANSDPTKDKAMIDALLSHLKAVTTEQFILMSTVDVLKNRQGVDEDTPVDESLIEPYGQNRHYMAEWVRGKFQNHLIVRLPGLFGHGLKKNFIFDLMHTEDSAWTDWRSTYQYYFLNHLWSDVLRAQGNHISLLHITSEPVSAAEVAERCFNIKFRRTLAKDPAHYDLRSKYAVLWGGKDGYLYSKDTVLGEIKQFAHGEKRQQ